VLLAVLFLVGLSSDVLAFDSDLLPVVSITDTDIFELFQKLFLAYFLLFVVVA